MKNMKLGLHSAVLLILSFLVLTIGACRQTSFDYGAVLETDSSGHFLKDIEYTYRTTFDWDSTHEYAVGKWSAVFSKDGSVLFNLFIYEDDTADFNRNGRKGEGYILLRKSEATYSYDNVNMLMTRTKETTTSYYSGFDGEYSFESAGDTYTSDWETVEITCFMTEHNDEGVYMKTGDAWVNTVKYIYGDGTSEIRSRSYTFGSTSVDYFYQTMDRTNTNTADHVQYQYESSFEITEEIPAGAEFQEGSTKQWNGFYTLVRSRYWDTGAFTAWEDNPNEDLGRHRSLEFLHMGEYIVFRSDLMYYERSLR